MSDKKQTTPVDPEAEFWKQDAARHNRMADLAKKLGYVPPLPVGTDADDDDGEDSDMGDAE